MKNLLLLLLLLFFSMNLLAQKRKKSTPYNYLFHSKTAEEIIALPNKMEKVYYSFIGHFDNKAQADTSKSPLFRNQEIITIPIWKKQRVGEYWIFVGWYQAGNLQDPLTQFVYKFTKLNRDTFAIERYDIPDEMRGLAWAEEHAYDNFKPQDLTRIGCTHYVAETKENHYFLQMPDSTDFCPAEKGLRAYSWVQLEVKMAPEQLILCNSFFDSNKKLLFTHKPIGNHFARIPKTEPRYLDILYPPKKKR